MQPPQRCSREKGIWGKSAVELQSSQWHRLTAQPPIDILFLKEGRRHPSGSSRRHSGGPTPPGSIGEGRVVFPPTPFTILRPSFPSPFVECSRWEPLRFSVFGTTPHSGGADDISNYNPSCRSCNRYKSTYTVERFRQQLQCIPARLERDASYCIARRFGLVDVEKTHVGFFFEETEPWKGDPSDDEDRTSHDVSGKGL